MKSNKNYRVFRLVLSSFVIYLSASLVMKMMNFHWRPLDNINLVSELFRSAEIEKVNEQKKETLSSLPVEQTVQFDLYQKPDLITNFLTNSPQPVLAKFVEKLENLKKQKKGKVRIAFFGDSMIEGDLMTQTLRKLLQAEFGGKGVGFVPMYSNVAGFRTTAVVSGKGWKDTHFMIKGASNLYLSGHRFEGLGMGSYEDKTIQSTDVVTKALLFGKINDAAIVANGTPLVLFGIDEVNRMVLSNDNNNKVSVQSKTSSLPLFGISFESENGVIVDNFSFRGITGIELGKIDKEMYNAVQKNNPYDLVILQYGVNLMFRPNDTDYEYYEKMMSPVLEKLKKEMPNTEFMLIGSADRAFRYNGEYKTAVGLPNLLKLQAELALKYNMAFYNNFATMGGENSIVKWANATPPLANKDYIHPNAKGAEILGQKLYEAIMKDYQKNRKRDK
ncbi:hypothetical protein JSO54_00550 [Riemerella anatipestifer]|uniref:hypothetical protein n=1 Tax=Riemerella anatipestifer TaxID=34085 RepID=UPI001374ED40|nr:hypothetical protein [Riemerella anatipestifer]